MRLTSDGDPASIGRIATAVGSAGGAVTAIDVVDSRPDGLTVDVTCSAADAAHSEEMVEALRAVPGVKVRKVSDRTFLLHLGGKIEVTSRVPLKTRDDLSMAYTPGVARVCLALAEHPEDVRRLTIKGNTVAVVTDGSAVLGLGNIGPGAAMPVMEGKAALFKRFADIDAWPICLDTQDVDEIVRTVELDRPRLRRHQPRGHRRPALLRDRGAAAREARHPGLPRRPARDGDRRAGRAEERAARGGQAAARREDRRRRWRRGRDGDRAPAAARPAPARCWCGTARASSRPTTTGSARPSWTWPQRTNPACVRGELPDALDRRRRVHRRQRRQRARRSRTSPAWRRAAIVFPMANPTPEVDPVRAREYAAIVASGRSDLPNQINNVLAFPGVFRGLLDARATEISDGMLLAAADALAAVVRDDQLNANFIIPSVFDPEVTAAVAARRRRAGPAPSPARPPRCGTTTAPEKRSFPLRETSANGGRRGGADPGIMGGCPSCPRWRRWPRSSARTPSATSWRAPTSPPSRRSRRSTRRCPRSAGSRSPARAGTGSSSTSTSPACTSSSTWRGPAGCTGAPACRPPRPSRARARSRCACTSTTATAST